jgi:hypothetical protein
MTALGLPTIDDRSAAGQVTALLPWFAAGTLTPVERKFVQDWLARYGDQHPGVVAELTWLRRTATQSREVSRVSPKLAQAGLNNLMLRIARDAGRQVPAATRPRPSVNGKPGTGLLARAGRGLANLFAPRPILVFGLLTVLLIQGGLIGKLMWRQPPAEQGLSSGEAEPIVKTIAASGGDAVFTVSFRANARESEIRDVLQGAGAQVIGGPSALGMYRISVPANKAEAAQAVLRGAIPNVLDTVKKDE